MEGDPLARITPWRSEGEGDAQDGSPVHNSNAAINMPSMGADTSAGTPSKDGTQEPSQAAAGWGDMGEFSMAPLDAPAFSGAEQSHQPEQRQQHSHSTRYDTRFPEPAEPTTEPWVGIVLDAHLTAVGCRCLLLMDHTAVTAVQCKEAA